MIMRDLALARSKATHCWDMQKAFMNYQCGYWKPILENRQGGNVGFVIAYHRINRHSKLGFKPTKNLVVHTTDFEEHLKFFKKNFVVISLTQAIERLRTHHPFPEPFVVLTFDDGYEDNFTDAFPLLEKHQLPATMFLTVGLVNHTVPLWHDLLEAVLAQTPLPMLDILVNKESQRFHLRTQGEKWYAYEWLTSHILQLPSNQREEFLHTLSETLQWNSVSTDDSHCRLLQWTQVRHMVKSGLIEFGSHTMSHHQISKLDKGEAEFEIGTSFRRLTEETGEKPSTFSYPNGTDDDISNWGIQLLESYGYQGACTMAGKPLTHTSQLFRIPRIGAGGYPLHGLAMKMASLVSSIT